MTLVILSTTLLGFLLSLLLLNYLLPGFKKQKELAKRAEELLLTQSQLIRKKDGALISFVMDKLLPSIEKRFTIDQVLGGGLRKEYNLLQYDVSFEHRIARMFVKAFVATFSFVAIPGLFLLVMPMPFPKGLLLVITVLFFVLIFFAQIQEIRKEYKIRQTEITKDLPLLIDKMIIALEAGRPFIDTIQEVERSSGPRMKHMLKKLSADMRFMKPESAIEAFAKSTGLQVMMNFSVAIKIGLNNGFDEAKKFFKSIKKDVNELHRIRIEETTKNKPARMYGLYALLIGHAFAAFIIAAVYIFGKVNEIM